MFTTQVLFVVFEKAWVLGAALCKILLYVQMVTLASTTFILTAMSVDRYLAICRPLSLGSTSGLTSRPKAMICIAWLGALIFASPQLFIFKQVLTLLQHNNNDMQLSTIIISRLIRSVVWISRDLKLKTKIRSPPQMPPHKSHYLTEVKRCNVNVQRSTARLSDISIITTLQY